MQRPKARVKADGINKMNLIIKMHRFAQHLIERCKNKMCIPNEISVDFVSYPRIWWLNKRYANKDRPTDVLAFLHGACPSSEPVVPVSFPIRRDSHFKATTETGKDSYSMNFIHQESYESNFKIRLPKHSSASDSEVLGEIFICLPYVCKRNMNTNLIPQFHLNHKLRRTLRMRNFTIFDRIQHRKVNRASLKRLERHVYRLLVHGFCHLLGHDHQCIKSWIQMRKLESKLMLYLYKSRTIL